MVLETFAAISLAGNVVQFADFSAKLFSQAKEIYTGTTGHSKDALNIIAITKSLREQCRSLSAATTRPATALDNSSGSPDLHGVALQELAKVCQEAAEELLGVLDSLEAKGSGSKQRKWESFRTCLRAAWKKDKIEEMAQRIDSARLQLILLLQQTDISTNLSLTSAISNHALESQQAFSDVKEQLGKIRSDILDDVALVREEPAATQNEDSNSARNSLSRTIPSVQSIDTLINNANNINEVLRATRHVLQTLRFSSMDDRSELIQVAHHDTCLQAFDEKLRSWFASDEPLCWVSGKPGSGKSTFMKFLSTYEQTTTELRNWAGQRQLVTASHYFWISGNPLQKSQEGLMRTILHDLLSKEPHLVPHVIPKHWMAALQDVTPEAKLEHEYLYPWTVKDLKEAFQKVTSHESEFCYCIFIDGLDEFSGDKDDLIETTNALHSLPNVKLCVSSRPWNIFESSFGHYPKLYMEELNTNDIKLCVKNYLEDLEEFKELEEEDGKLTEITQEIVGNARGVFLWVYLVVRELRNGLRNYDSLTILQQRLRKFPTDLDGFFRHIFNSMDEIYWTPAARIFQIALFAESPLRAITYFWIGRDDIDLDTVIRIKPNFLEPSILRKRQSRVAKTLNGRLMGLLECNLERIDNSTGFEAATVDFLHRTVRDFLKTSEMQERLREWSLPGFDPYHLLCKALLADVKTSPQYSSTPGVSGLKPQPLNSWAKAFSYARMRCDARLAESTFHNEADVLGPIFSEKYFRVVRSMENSLELTCRSFEEGDVS
ncbi:hypothetical protein BT63DRAFT_426413 [Microthyrium microscopicum]|uniref:Uncharacterized protein n=1 Tax=Microthyrium microscopicum TaxID=703497 RepID=A0A6A6U5X1_9PEZI|nr:hypothetical protein BT63DRAFT_426413 [Microthyrium microscopicum]